MYFKPDDSRKILDETNHKIVEVIGDYVPLTKKAHLNKYAGKCPVCGKPDALQVDPATGIYKCFKCKECGGNDAVGFLRKYQNMTYPQALEHLMKKFSVVIAGPDQKPAPKKIKKDSAPYCETMMLQSGLSKEDITAFVRPFEHIKPKLVPIFRKGTHNSAFEPIADGDDVIIDYYDLDGNPVMFEVKKKGTPTGKKKLFFRVRYQFPDEHKDEKGKSVKYRSPYGSSNFIFIPDKIRQMHGEGKTIDRLFVQEGEKKAEKACKHGVWSIGISGINNLAQDQHLPEDFIRIIRDMEVKQVVLLFDGDYNDLHHDIKITDNVQKRPLNFYYAARNFGEYMSTLKGRQLVVQPYVGHINKNEHDDKGIDDLLSNTLKGKEEDLRFDIENLMLQKSLKGDYMTLYKINTINPEYKLSEIWSLHSAQSFAEVHKEELKKLSEFRIGKHIWKFSEEGKLESAQPLEEEEKYWNKSWNERNQKNIY
jgi:ribosomal protein L37AE/L43A